MFLRLHKHTKKVRAIIYTGDQALSCLHQQSVIKMQINAEDGIQIPLMSYLGNCSLEQITGFLCYLSFLQK